MEKLFEIYGDSSYNKVFSEDGSLNHVRINKNVVTHKQVERRSGKIYMRMKKRDLLTCS
ncbi:MAG: hypothetical protein ACLFTR_01745 [Candidatus Woesearchaeota archaeon]